MKEEGEEARKRCTEHRRLVEWQQGKEGAFVLGRMMRSERLKIFVLKKQAVQEFAVSPTEHRNDGVFFPRLEEGKCKIFSVEEGRMLHLIWSLGKDLGAIDSIQKDLAERAEGVGLPGVEDLERTIEAKAEVLIGEGKLVPALIAVVGVSVCIFMRGPICFLYFILII